MIYNEEAKFDPISEWGAEETTNRRADGLLELGLFLDAWNGLEELPTEQRNFSQVLGFRVKNLVGLKKLEAARIVAEGMAEKIPEASESWQSLALVFLAEGDKKTLSYARWSGGR